jgi:hypothetical protein
VGFWLVQQIVSKRPAWNRASYWSNGSSLLHYKGKRITNNHRERTLLTTTSRTPSKLQWNNCIEHNHIPNSCTHVGIITSIWLEETLVLCSVSISAFILNSYIPVGMWLSLASWWGYIPISKLAALWLGMNLLRTPSQFHWNHSKLAVINILQYNRFISQVRWKCLVASMHCSN